jgi:hypothetical protein
MEVWVMSMLSRQEDQAERLEVIENDKKLRGSPSDTSAHGGSTFFSHTHNEVGGRYAAISSPQIVGSTALPKYEGAPNWATDLVPTEPPLAYDNPALHPSAELGLHHEAALVTANPGREVNTSVSHVATPLAAGRSGLALSSRTYRRA